MIRERKEAMKNLMGDISSWKIEHIDSFGLLCKTLRSQDIPLLIMQFVLRFQTHVFDGACISPSHFSDVICLQ